MNPDAYKNPEPKQKTWACPCNGCKKAQKVIIDQIIADYKSCPNIIEADERIYCYTYYRHDDCVRLMNLLNKITNDSKYTQPKNKEEVKDSIVERLIDPHASEILKKLEDKGI